MHPLETLVANTLVFAAIVLTLLLLYLAIASLFWHRYGHIPPPPVVSQVPGPAGSTEEDPAVIAGEISAKLEKLLAEKQHDTINKEALLKKLLRSERFKG